MRKSVVAAVVCVPLALSSGGCTKKEEKTPETVTVVVPPPVNAPLLQKGAKVFAEKCASCHLVNGAGGTAGPDLSRIGAQRDALYLQTQLQDPTAYKPDSKMPSFKDMPKDDKDALVAYLLSLK